MPPDEFSVLRANSINTSDSRVTKSAATASPTANASLNPRSCVTCRRRKVKCDKKKPCSNCVKAHIECVFPAPGRAPRKPRKPQDTELMDRLRKLESVVQSLGAQVQDESQSPEKDEETNKEEEKKEGETPEDEIRKKIKELKQLKRQKWEVEGKKPPDMGLESRFGRLVVGDGKSRYINPSFWASLSNEVEDIKGLLDDSDDDDLEDYPSPVTSSSASNHQGFIFGLSSTSVQMSALHPPADHIKIYWEVFKENIDPLVKIIHIPSKEPTILETANQLNREEKLQKGHEALMFAIYYSAVTSMWPNECRAKFGEEKTDLLARYRFGVEQALSRADFLQSDEIVVIQAFILFLMTLRRNDDARVIWTLTGLVVRMAQTLGLHRDGSHYENLSPFQIEMRRRIWWQAVILDARASEDHGCDPTIVETITDTQFPRNINDSEFGPDTIEMPPSRSGCTEMTFGLIRFEISSALRKIQYIPPGIRGKHCFKVHGPHGIDRKKEMIQNLTQRLEDHYLKDCDLTVPLYWVIATVSRLILSKMWLMLYHPYQRQDGGASLPQDVRDGLFKTALENVEYAELLEREQRTLKYSWLFKTYIQWHAIAFLLNELCVRTTGPEVERAWRAVELTTSRRWEDETASNKLKGHLWKPLRRLMARAKAERDKAVAAEQKEAAILGVAPTAETDGLMTLDFGVDRLYPTQPLPHSDKDALPSQNASVPTSMFPPPVPMSLDLNPTTQPSTVIPSAGFEFGMQQSFGDTQMNGAPASPENYSGANSNGHTGTTPVLDDGSQLNWANWDDMVQEFGLQFETSGNGGQPVPSVFGSGANWY